MSDSRKRTVARRYRRRAAGRSLGTDTGSDTLVAEAAARMTVPLRRVRVAMQAAQRLSDAELGVVEQLTRLAESGASAARRSVVAAGLRRALESITRGDRSDPLAQVDEPLDAASAADAVLRAEVDIEIGRRQLLQRCVAAVEAGALIGRSRQALERLRREGRALALRVGNQWRYPQWQFDPDAPGGIVPGLHEVLASLRLSPSGAALWLTRTSVRLGNRAPIEALRRREREAVVRLATEQGIMP